MEWRVMESMERMGMVSLIWVEYFSHLIWYYESYKLWHGNSENRLEILFLKAGQNCASRRDDLRESELHLMCSRYMVGKCSNRTS